MDNPLLTDTDIYNFQRLLDRSSDNGMYNQEENPQSNPMLFPNCIAQPQATATTNANPASQNVQLYAKNLHPATTISQDPIKTPRIFDQMCHKYKNVDGGIIKVFECPICQKECTYQYTLNRHLSTHSTERRYCCYICGKGFRQMSTLTQHKAIHSSERPHVCEVCHKTFNRVSTLISHKKTHTGVKPHQCHLCLKAFHQKGNLRNHIFTHTRERPYKCDICDKGFNQKSNLTCHKSKAHQDQNHLLPQYNCEICDASFSKRNEMRSHEQLEHDGRGQNATNAVRVDPIETDAMKAALASGRTPFALLRPLSGVPVLVRVHPDGGKQMLLPATAEDLKRFGTISTRSKTQDNQDPYANKGSIVEIRLPVVATVIQTSSDEDAALTVQSPEQTGDILGTRGGDMADLNVDSYVYISSLLETIEDITDGDLPNLSQLNFNPALFDNCDNELLSVTDEAESGNVAPAANTQVVENEMPDCIVIESSTDDNNFENNLELPEFNYSEFIDGAEDDYLILPF